MMVAIVPALSARKAGLVYVNADSPGIARKGRETFHYVSPAGQKIRKASTLRRIEKLVIPPAWRDVWICPEPRGHLQATGFDERGRKQYLYHLRWREIRDRTKYDKLIAFGKVLGKVRARIKRDLRRHGLPKEKVLATIVELLQTTCIRVGNEEYARVNHSFGLTTLREKHVKIKGGTLHFHFKGKSGVVHAIDLHDRRLAKIVKQCQELPGQELFHYLDENGDPHTVKSEDVNHYLREVTGQDFTAKDFRTWSGTVLAAVALSECEPCTSATGLKRNIVQAIDKVSQRLGNTRSVCRKCYVHPAVFEAYTGGTFATALDFKNVNNRATGSLSSEERVVLAFLKARSRSRRKAK